MPANHLRRVGRCDRCGFDWDTPVDELLVALPEAIEGYRPALAGLADRWRERPAPDVWSPLEYLAHMGDVTEFYRDRIERVLTEDRPVLSVGVRLAELIEQRRDRSQDPARLLDALETMAAAVGQRLNAAQPTEWSRIGIGSEGDQRTVLDLARRLTHEARHHLVDITKPPEGAKNDDWTTGS